jgi:hypothetical protein
MFTLSFENDIFTAYFSVNLFVMLRAICTTYAEIPAIIGIPNFIVSILKGET